MKSQLKQNNSEDNSNLYTYFQGKDLIPWVGYLNYRQRNKGNNHLNSFIYNDMILYVLNISYGSLAISAFIKGLKKIIGN